ncbi:MAG: VOC family protein [Burkholderiales bacterium]|jgi:PhnB protein|nr:VOC family protein [Burkholderiales bacterium]
MMVHSYLFFDGRCEEALAFYARALDARVTMLMRNRESPDPVPPGMLPPGSEDKVMHAQLRVGDTEIMVSDGRCGGKPQFDGFSLALSVPDDDDARRRFDALAEGGQVQMPLSATFWATSFGMVQDRFGVVWMVMAPRAQPQAG